MFRLRLGVLAAMAAVAALAISGYAASGASAVFVLTETACEGTTIAGFCYEKEKTAKLFELSGSQAFTGVIKAGTKAILKGKLGGEAIEITCTEANAKGEIKSEPLVKNYTGTGKIAFKGCVLAGALGEKCKVPVEKETLELAGEGTNASSVTFKPAAGKVFIEIPIEEKAKCPATIKGNKLVEGEQVCTWQTVGTDSETHELKCVEKSALKFAEQAAELTLTEVVSFTSLGDLWTPALT